MTNSTPLHDHICHFYSSDTTLALLEYELPTFFEGASHLYYEQLKGEIIIFRWWFLCVGQVLICSVFKDDLSGVQSRM